MTRRNDLLLSAAHSLPAALLGKALLEATLLTGLQIEAVLLDVFADTFTLYLAAKATESLLKWFIVSDGHDYQAIPQPLVAPFYRTCLEKASSEYNADTHSPVKHVV